MRRRLLTIVLFTAALALFGGLAFATLRLLDTERRRETAQAQDESRGRGQAISATLAGILAQLGADQRALARRSRAKPEYVEDSINHRVLYFAP